MSEEFTKLQQNYDLFLADVIKKSSLFVFTPTNAKKERLTFKKSAKYNPQFEYKSLNETSEMYKDIMSSITIHEKSGNKYINQMLVNKHADLKSKFDLSASVGKSSFTSKSIKVYGKANSRLIKKAESILSEDFTPRRKTFVQSDEMVLQLKKYFRDLKITGWKVKKADLVTSANINCEKKLLELKKRERMNQNYVERLKVHEIGTHALRFENGANQPLSILKYGLKGYLSTEEGLAMYSEERCDVSSPSIKRNYAGRVLATTFALESSFKDVYKNLLAYFKPEVAFKLALRAKRGLADTSEPGGFTKDYVYLKGYYAVKRFAKKNDLTDLYYGKICIKDIPNIKKIPFLNPPKFLPDFLRDQNKDN